MKNIIKIFLVFCLATVFPLKAESPENEPVKAEILYQKRSLQPGSPAEIAVRMTLADGWHAYWKNPGDIGVPIDVKWELPEGFSIESQGWPYPNAYNTDGIITYGYENEIVFLYTLTAPQDISLNEASLQAKVKWVACSHEMCLPGSADLTLHLPVLQNTSEINDEHSAILEEARKKLPAAGHELNARINGELIELHLPAFIQSSEEIAFFEEHPGTISQEKELIVSKSGNHLVIVMKAGDKFRLKKGLHGVLVLGNTEGKQALDIHVLVEKDAKELDAIGMSSPLAAEGTSTAASQLSDGFWMALIFAFLGGVILNLMPCVLPVISLKILSFVKIAGEDRKKILKHGLAYSLGVLISFWTLAGLLLILQAYGTSIGWGFQLQNPVFIAVLTAIIFLFSLSLFGVFEMGTSLMGAAGKVEKKPDGLGGALLSGVLATALATPCTGPFLGTAVGIATTLSTPLAMLVFTSLGLGMASPYLVFSAFPAALKLLPKPGNWMITFKEFTGFFMVSTVLWLLWVFSAQAGSSALILMLASLFFLSVAAWVYGKWCSPVRKKNARLVGYILSFALTALSGTALYVATAPGSTEQPLAAYSGWEEFSPERIEELRLQGTPVFVDFTAKWCLICQANHVVLTTNKVEDLFHEKGIVRMKADWTLHDQVITEELRKFGRSGVPLYVYYPANGDPVILPQVLTPDIVADTVYETAKLAQHDIQ